MTGEELRAALNRAYRLGQNYWAQADSDYTSQWKKAEVTQATFEQLVEDAVSAFEEQAIPEAEIYKRKWVGLTDEEIIDVIHPLVMADIADEATDYEIARAIEAKLKEKNT